MNNKLILCFAFLGLVQFEEVGANRKSQTVSLQDLIVSGHARVISPTGRTPSAETALRSPTSQGPLPMIVTQRDSPPPSRDVFPATLPQITHAPTVVQVASPRPASIARQREPFSRLRVDVGNLEPEGPPAPTMSRRINAPPGEPSTRRAPATGGLLARYAARNAAAKKIALDEGSTVIASLEPSEKKPSALKQSRDLLKRQVDQNRPVTFSTKPPEVFEVPIGVQHRYFEPPTDS
jgi:hypothetical protein